MSDPFNMENVAAMAGLPHTRREMTDTVRIMPRQPIEAKRDEFGEGYYVERGTSIIQRDYLNSGGVGWVEVPEPIVWDGSEASAKAINDALPDGHTASPAETSVYGHLGIKSAGDHPRYASIEADWRIRIEGDSFAILPPKEEQS